jgi:hypothetical protein
MNAEERHQEDIRGVKRILGTMGYQFDLYVIEAVLEAWEAYLHESMPVIDGDKANKFILDNLLFDPKFSGAASMELLDKIDDLKVEYMIGLGIIPEDVEEDDE